MPGCGTGHEEGADQAAGQRRPASAGRRARACVSSTGGLIRRLTALGGGAARGRPQLASSSGEGGLEITVWSRRVLVPVGAAGVPAWRAAASAAAAAAPPGAGTPRRAWPAPRAPATIRPLARRAPCRSGRPVDEVGLVEHLQAARGSGARRPGPAPRWSPVARHVLGGAQDLAAQRRGLGALRRLAERGARPRRLGALVSCRAPRRPRRRPRPGPQVASSRGGRLRLAGALDRLGARRLAAGGRPHRVSTSWVRLRRRGQGVLLRELALRGELDDMKPPVTERSTCAAPLEQLHLPRTFALSRRPASGTPGQHAQLRKVFEEARPEVNPGDPQTARSAAQRIPQSFQHRSELR